MAKLNYELTTKIYTVEELIQELSYEPEEVFELYGQYVQGFVWAMLHDDSIGYAQRLFAPIYSDSFVGNTQAMQAVTLELMQDYFKARQRKGRPSFMSPV